MEWKLWKNIKKKLKEEKRSAEGQPKTTRDIIRQQQTWVGWLIFFVLTSIMAFPLTVLIHRVVPQTGWFLPVVVQLIVSGGLLILFRIFKFTVWTIIALVLAGLGISTAIGKYTYKDVGYDYLGFLYNISNEKKSLSDVFTQRPFPRYREFLKSSHFTPKVRQYSLKAATKNFSKYKKDDLWNYVQYFSIFKEINDQWQYVSDPTHRDYIAPAEESLETFCGDCDDYSVAVAACITSVGGTVRLVRTQTHVYPELKIENPKDFDRIKKLIRNKLFKKEVKKKKIYYHKDGYGDIWINLDYTAKYPGGKFLRDDFVSVLEIP